MGLTIGIGGSGGGGGGRAVFVADEMIFADATARDAYFLANAAKLKEGLYVVTAGKLQQYVSGVWTDMSILIRGLPGLSAYEVWLSEGNAGSATDFLLSLKGTNGKSIYDLWLDDGNVGTVSDFILSLKGIKGDPGKTAYEYAVDGGYSGTESDFKDLLGQLEDIANMDISGLKDLAFKDKVSWPTDIDNPPAIPAKTSDLTNDSGFLKSSDLPTPPAVNDGILTIKKNAADAGTSFSANQASNVSIDLGLGTMAAEAATDYRKSAAQDTIDAAKVDKVAGMGLSEASFTQSEKDKLANLDSSKFLGGFPSVTALQTDYPDGGTGGKWTTFAGDKEGCAADVSVSGIVHEFAYNSGAWVDMGQTGSDSEAMIKQKYESNADTNAFTDAEKTKLASALTSFAPLDTEFAKKLDKSNSTSTVYATDSSGNQTVQAYSVAALADVLVKRAGNGHIAVQLTPTADDHATSKKYVDDGLSAHKSDGTAHSDIRSEVVAAKAIAEGKARARVFNTKAALDTWLLTPANVAELQIGDNFYIVDTDVPDFWWTGTGILPLEGEKVDLTDFYDKTEADSKFATVAGIAEWAKSQQIAGSAGDANTLIKNGIYKLNAGSTNTPNSLGWHVLVINDGVYCKQLFLQDSTHGIWERSMNVSTGVWGSYRRVLNTDDFTTSDRSKLDFEGSDAASSLNGMAIAKHITHVSASTNQSFSVASVACVDKAFIVDFTATAALTIAMPSTSTPSAPTDYINDGDDSYTLDADRRIMIHVFKSSTTGKYHVDCKESNS